MIDVKMFPSPYAEMPPSGIATVVQKYKANLEPLGYRFVDPKSSSFDILAIHAGVRQVDEPGPFVSHCHGLYWSAHYDITSWERDGNIEVIDNIRKADCVTVPSEWVAKTFQRDMHLSPFVLPHGIDTDEWVPVNKDDGYVLWNKNRTSDVCSPEPVSKLASARPDILFYSTFGRHSNNMKIIGLKPYDEMKEYVRHSMVYLNTTEETFGIGILEAMASGVPILAFRNGNATFLVEHGVNGYLAAAEDYDDLANGLDYCIRNRKVLGENSRELAKRWSWKSVASGLDSIYKLAINMNASPHAVTVVIPCYNKASTLERAVNSALRQSVPPAEIIIVDNNSSDESASVARTLAARNNIVRLEKCERQGVAHARNHGLYLSRTRYTCCLDSDDEIHYNFLESCVSVLEKHRDLGLSYTKMEVVDQNGMTYDSDWPDRYDFNDFYQRKNPVPTCCVFRTDVALRLGGYRQRYAPNGAGAEDVELWCRMGEIGYGGALAIKEHLFRYYLGGQVSGNPNYNESDWLYFHRAYRTSQHPLASLASSGIGGGHPVRKYNEPIVSVVIPCGESHLSYLWDALDSLEGQTFPLWEAIVVLDGEFDQLTLDRLWAAYPFVNFIKSDKIGAGAARNKGAEKAIAYYLLFLDADDTLEPFCLEQMLEAANNNKDSIVYTDYIGRAYGVTDPSSLSRAGRLLHYDESDGFAVIRYFASPYDCERAQIQPQLSDNGQFYIWNLISSLTPKKFHDAIGGFDESMESWEDWDYWIRMSKQCFDFYHVHEPLVSYRFYTGARREIGRQLAQKLLDYLRTKYTGENQMACCGGKKKMLQNPNPVMSSLGRRTPMAYSSSDMVRIQFQSQSFGEPVTIRDLDTNQLHDYGFRKGGEVFLMLRKHAEYSPHRFVVVEDVPAIFVEEPKEAAEPLPQPVAAMESQSEPLLPPKPVEKTYEKPVIMEKPRATRGRPKSSNS